MHFKKTKTTTHGTYERFQGFYATRGNPKLGPWSFHAPYEDLQELVDAGQELEVEEGKKVKMYARYISAKQVERPICPPSNRSARDESRLADSFWLKSGWLPSMR